MFAAGFLNHKIADGLRQDFSTSREIAGACEIKHIMTLNSTKQNSPQLTDCSSSTERNDGSFVLQLDMRTALGSNNEET